MRLLIVIPAYNEAENIESVVQNLRMHWQEDWDFLIINDASRDSTAEICRTNGYPFLNLPVNLGIGGVVQTGYRYALEHEYDIAVQFDGDGQHLAEYIQDLTLPIERGTADFVIGSRFIRKEGFQSSLLRRIGINFLSGLIHLLCGVKVLDVTSGMRAVNRKMIRFFAENYAQDYPEPEAILASGLAGARITEVPVKMRERQNGTSSINPLRSVYYMVKVSLARFFARASYRRRTL